jgi:hypothetical protein
LKTKNIYFCNSCDHLTEDGSPLILKDEEDYDHHKSKRHNVTIKQVDSTPENVSQKLAKFATKSMLKVVMSRSDSTRVFAVVKMNTHYETIELDKKNPRAIGWLQVAYFDESGNMCSDEQCSSAIGFLKQKTLMTESSPQEDIHLRCAFVDGEIFYDLGRGDWKIIRINKNGINFIDYGINTPIFYRTSRIAKQTEPNLRPDIDALSEFVKLIRVPNPEMFKVQLISMFVAGVPMPSFAIHGHSGSAKSATSSMIKRIIDPAGMFNKDNLKSFPRGEDNFIVSLASTYFSSFENVSHIDKEISDTICRAVTGSSYEKRTHYSNDEVFVISMLRKILINGIDFEIREADLVDRVIVYRLERIAKTQRLSEKQIEKIFRKLLPDLLGQIFLILQKALQIIDSIEENLPYKERMADFTVTGEAIYQSMGHSQGDFLDLFNVELQKNLQNLHDSNPIVKIFDEILGSENERQIQAEELYKEMGLISSTNGFSVSRLPKSSSGIQSLVDRSKTLLDDSDILVTSYNNTQSKESSGFTPNSKVYVIKRVVSEQTKLKDRED